MENKEDSPSTHTSNSNSFQHADEDDDEHDHEGRLGRDKFKRERDERESSPSGDRRKEVWDEYGRLVVRGDREGGNHHYNNNNYNGGGRRGPYPPPPPYGWRGDEDMRDYRRERGGRDFRNDNRRRYERSPSPGRDDGRRKRDKESPPFKRRRRSEERDDYPPPPHHRESYTPGRYREDRGGRRGGRGPRSSWPYDEFDMPMPPMDPYMSMPRGRRSNGGPMSLYDGAMLTYKQYVETQDDSLGPTELQKKYEDYSAEYNTRLSRSFFNEHKNEKWFSEKYHPTFIEKRWAEKIGVAKEKVGVFTTELAEKPAEYWSLNVTDELEKHREERGKHEEDEGENGELSHEEDEAGASTRRTEGEEGGADTKPHSENGDHSNSGSTESGTETSDSSKKIINLKPSAVRHHDKLDQPLDSSSADLAPSSNVVFIKTLSPSVGRDDIINLFKTCLGFQRLTLSEPMKHKNFHRYGWVTYESAEMAAEALRKLTGSKINEFELNLAINKTPVPYRPAKIAPPTAAEEERIVLDHDQSKRLCEQLDKEKTIDNNPLFQESFQSDTTLKGVDKLDRYVNYMRSVHAFCYYCGEEFDDEDEMFRKCGVKHVRGRKSTDPIDVKKDPWASSLDVKINSRIENKEHMAIITAKKRMEQKLEDYFKSNVTFVEEGKYRCGVCSKLFKGDNFVINHINAKHPEKVEEEKAKMKEQAIEKQFFENYHNDPKRITVSLPPAYPQMPPRGMGGPSPMRGSRYNWPPMPLPPPPPYYGSYYSPPPRGRGGPRRGGGERGMGRGSRPSPSGGRPHPMEPPPGASADPRALREYVDLDAPPEDDMAIDYKGRDSHE